VSSDETFNINSRPYILARPEQFSILNYNPYMTQSHSIFNSNKQYIIPTFQRLLSSFETLNPELNPNTINPKSQTVNPHPKTSNPKPQTLNPKL